MSSPFCLGAFMGQAHLVALMRDLDVRDKSHAVAVTSQLALQAP